MRSRYIRESKFWKLGQHLGPDHPERRQSDDCQASRDPQQPANRDKQERGQEEDDERSSQRNHRQPLKSAAVAGRHAADGVDRVEQEQRAGGDQQNTEPAKV